MGERYLTQDEQNSLDEMLIELSEFLMHIVEAIVYYQTHHKQFPMFEWGLTEKNNNFSVHLKFGRLMLLSGYDFPSDHTADALEYMEWLREGLKDNLRDHFGVELGEIKEQINPN